MGFIRVREVRHLLRADFLRMRAARVERAAGRQIRQ
jgi:hypothetical protein